MEEDEVFELGWGFYVIILPLIATIVMEAIIKPLVNKLDIKVFKLKMKVLLQKEAIKKIKKWINS